MSFQYINSYPELNIEYELPFFLRAVGSSKNIAPVDYMSGYNYHYIGMIQSGSIKIQVKNYTRTLNANDAFFVRSHFPFRFQAIDGPACVHWFAFDGFATIPLFSKLEIENYMFYHQIDQTIFSNRIMELYINSINTDKGSRLKNSVLVYDILIDLYNCSPEGKKSLQSSIQNPTLLRAKRCIEQYYSQPISQKEIAKAADITPQYLCRLFQSELNITPIAYLNKIRIHHAKYLLRTTTLPIQVIAEQVGLPTAHYFSSTFQRFEGMTPSRYRAISNTDPGNNSHKE